MGSERKKKYKTDILRVRGKRKKKLLLKKICICHRRLFHLFQKIIFFVVVSDKNEIQIKIPVGGWWTGRISIISLDFW
jgi:hypothetical protein